jgi:carboxylesterase type B
MSDDVENTGDDAVVDDSTDSSLASATGNGIRAGAHDQNTIFQTTNHDQNTIFQQNNAQQNEFLQTLAEVRRQNVVLFEQRVSQDNAMFAAHMSQLAANAAAAAAAANGLLTQQQSYNHSQATQDRMQTSADYLVSVGITTPWLP